MKRSDMKMDVDIETNVFWFVDDIDETQEPVLYYSPEELQLRQWRQLRRLDKIPYSQGDRFRFQEVFAEKGISRIERKANSDAVVVCQTGHDGTYEDVIILSAAKEIK